MNKKHLVAGIAVLLIGGTYVIKRDSGESYSEESAKQEMLSVISDLESWYDAAGTYIGGPSSNGVMLAAGDTMWGASKRFRTGDGDVCIIAGDLGSGSKVTVATEDKPCSDEGIKELQNYICQIEGKQDSCPEI